MTVRDSRFPAIQMRLRSLGFYPAHLAVDNEFGDGMAAAIDAALDRLEGQTGMTPPSAPASHGVDFNRLPPAYRWLARESYLPKHLVEAIKLFGTVETPGAADSPIIMGWRDELRAAGVDIKGYSADSVPWCGLFAAIVMHRAGRPVCPSPLWALSWSTWGKDGAQPELGDLLTFKRPGGGHVALYIAEDRQGYYHVLGGNQGDKVNIMRIAKTRMHACRQPDYAAKPANIRPVIVSAGGEVSSNEA